MGLLALRLSLFDFSGRLQNTLPRDRRRGPLLRENRLGLTGV